MAAPRQTIAPCRAGVTSATGRTLSPDYEIAQEAVKKPRLSTPDPPEVSGIRGRPSQSLLHRAEPDHGVGLWPAMQGRRIVGLGHRPGETHGHALMDLGAGCEARLDRAIDLVPQPEQAGCRVVDGGPSPGRRGDPAGFRDSSGRDRETARRDPPSRPARYPKGRALRSRRRYWRARRRTTPAPRSGYSAPEDPWSTRSG